MYPRQINGITKQEGSRDSVEVIVVAIEEPLLWTNFN